MVNAIKSNATTIVNSHEIGYIPSSIILYIVFTVYYHSRVIFPDVLAQLITDKIANKRRQHHIRYYDKGVNVIFLQKICCALPLRRCMYISVLLLSLLRETFILILDLSRTRAETCSMFVINFYEFMGWHSIFLHCIVVVLPISLLVWMGILIFRMNTIHVYMYVRT